MGGGRLDHLPAAASAGRPDGVPSGTAPGGVGHQVDGVQTRRVLLHASGFKQSPYADVAPSGGDARSAPRRLWHSSPGSSGG